MDHGKDDDGCSCMQSHDVDTEDMFRSIHMHDHYNEYAEGITLNEFKQLVVVETAEMLKKSAQSDQKWKLECSAGVTVCLDSRDPRKRATDSCWKAGPSLRTNPRAL
ncbi:uncharacterized protein LOC119598903 [Penaeus monodon]|uniref:uncharacterized protein LOC119598903 n=1 Tax=Penaeus monodon TaxID=6687 RepID=UPI0018A7639D|nr:uncharacterized protein LOC119598903 [Penaeus monodon]